jgi:hypothetical protein
MRDRCRKLLRKGLVAIAPAFERLAITNRLGDVVASYLSGLDADTAIGSCAALTEKERTCLEAAANPIVASLTCAPDEWHSKYKLPKLFSFFGYRPLEERFHPAVEPKLERFAGTWVGKEATWIITPHGELTIQRAGQPDEHHTLDATHAGKLGLRDGHGTSFRFVTMPDANTLEIDREGAPTIADDHFVAPTRRSAWLVREPTGCWLVTELGVIRNATCTAKPHGLEAAYEDCDRAPCQTETLKLDLYPGWVAEQVSSALVLHRK